MTDALSTLADTASLCSLSLYAGRITGSIVGRPLELAAVEQEMASAQSGMACITLEGEPGIGKTRMLLAIEELARGRGFATIAVTADEEIRGPFLLARSIFGSITALDVAKGTRSEAPMQRVADALSGNDPIIANLPPDQKVMRTFDLAVIALGALASERPLALLIDDLQWADEDSIRMLRYAVRAAATSRIFLVFAVRRDEVAFVNEAVTLFADLERMGLLRRLRLGRFSQVESTEFLQQTLGGPINLTTAATMHAQAEGVPFVLGEQVRAYRDAGLIQQIDGVWTLARNAERLVPSAVRTLIQRRATRLPDETRTNLGEAAVLGRNFSLRDLLEVKKILGDPPQLPDALAESLEPAVRAGLLVPQSDAAAADFSFTHGQIREHAVSALSSARRRAIHAAIVQMLTANQDPPPESLPLLAQHALLAGQTELCARLSIEAARRALKANSPEETLRLVEMAHPVASTALDRVALLGLRDDALEMLRRPNQRLEGLAELAALAEALGDSHLELDVMLRRAAALRLSREHERASEIAERVRVLAAERGDLESELAACLELGQDLLRTDLGEGYSQTHLEGDIDGGAAAFEDAARLARGLDDQSRLAAAVRELGIIAVSRLRTWFVQMIQAGEHTEVLTRIAAGERLDDILPTLPIAPFAMEAGARFTEALEIYERLGDRQGAMSTIIAMAWMSWGPEIHLGGSAKRIEEIRRLSTRMKSLTNESERALAEAQMLFGSHVYSRAKVFPDVAIAKGQEAYTAAQTLGDRSLEFSAAGGVAMAFAEVGSIESAEQWLVRASDIAASEPTPYRARQLDVWRGSVRAAAGDAEGMQELLQRAVRLATDQGRPAARCETLALLALGAARLGADRGDQELLALGERAAREVKALAPLLPGHPPWGAQADAALARVATARGARQDALQFGRSALEALDHAQREDSFLEILLPAAEAVLAAGNEAEVTRLRARLRLTLALLSGHLIDENIRALWFRNSTGRELTRLTGLDEPVGPNLDADGQDGGSLRQEDLAFLRLLTEGNTNLEIAQALGSTEEAVSRQLIDLYAKIGVSSRADATSAALLGKLI